MRNKFDRVLEEVNNDLIKMGTLIEDAISKSIVALREGNESLAREVINSDSEVDSLERSIERRCLMILLSEQPVARDLRAISTALRMITDMERICDQAADIAEITLRFMCRDGIKTPIHIVQMAEKSVRMVSRSIDSFITQDLNLAREIVESDDEVDALFVTVREEIVSIIREDTSNCESEIDFMIIAKYLERIADHAVNIAEWVIFNITGSRKNERIL
jgi:phosphate transport system protein